MLDNEGYKHALRMCKTNYFFTERMVARTRFSVKLYVHYLFYFKLRTAPGNKVRAEAVLCYSSI